MTKIVMPLEVIPSQTEREYLLIKDAFYRLIYNCENSAESWGVIEDIILLRVSFLIDRVLTGLQIDFDRALDLIRNYNEFTTERERNERDILVAAIENLINFAVAEEIAMIRELPDELERDKILEYEIICEKYNLIYAQQENSQVLFSAKIAYWWLGVSQETIVTYMTQGDERVRAWHLSLEGISYRKSQFPPELIPPIEWGCRCFLIADGFNSVYATLKPNYIKKINPVFSESLAKGGRIFSSAHPYFEKELPVKTKEIAIKLKMKFNLL